jgi:type II secretory pathway predicted ATPase ExeA
LAGERHRRLRAEERPDLASAPFDPRPFHLDQDPFSRVPDPNFFYTNAQLRALYTSLLNSIRAHSGLFLLSGDRGMGKTILLTRLAQELRASNYLVISTYRAGLRFQDLASVLSAELGMCAFADDDQQCLTRIQGLIAERSDAQHGVVLFIDDAQKLGFDVISKLDLLIQAPDGGPGALRLVLAGEPQIRRCFDFPVFARLVGTLVLRHELEPLGDGDIATLVWHRLRRAGLRGTDLFTDGGMAAITRRAKGVPGRAVALCASTLRLASAAGQISVTEELVERAASELAGPNSLPEHGAEQRPSPDERGPFRASGVQLPGALLVGLGVSCAAALAVVAGAPDAGSWAWSIGQTISSSMSARSLPPNGESSDGQAAYGAGHEMGRQQSPDDDTALNGVAAASSSSALPAAPLPGAGDDDTLERMRSAGFEANLSDRPAGSTDGRIPGDGKKSAVGTTAATPAGLPSSVEGPPAEDRFEAVGPDGAPDLDHPIVSEADSIETLSLVGPPDQTAEPVEIGAAGVNAAPNASQPDVADNAGPSRETDARPHDLQAAVSDAAAREVNHDARPAAAPTARSDDGNTGDADDPAGVLQKRDSELPYRERDRASQTAANAEPEPPAAPSPILRSPEAAASAGEMPRVSKLDPADRINSEERSGSSSATFGAGAASGIASEAAPPGGRVQLSKEMIGMLMNRGHDMLAIGDISAARLLYERAAAAGDPRAATAAGKTYDPLFLKEIAARGVRPRPDRAAEWYGQADAAGDAEAGARLKRLISAAYR